MIRSPEIGGGHNKNRLESAQMLVRSAGALAISAVFTAGLRFYKSHLEEPIARIKSNIDKKL